MKYYNASQNRFDHSILKTYLQLILALCSREKQKQIENLADVEDGIEATANFQSILEVFFLQSKDVSFYAAKEGISTSAFSKKIKHRFGKSPSKLIQERVALEAKKLLHLTTDPIKEIAARLNFDDEFYFSRYFKKQVGVSPKQFRERVGISIVAKQSM
nr:helix-turn-helix domain-containing protein [Niabella ginsengisoli]